MPRVQCGPTIGVPEAALPADFTAPGKAAAQAWCGADPSQESAAPLRPKLALHSSVLPAAPLGVARLQELGCALGWGSWTRAASAWTAPVSPRWSPARPHPLPLVHTQLWACLLAAPDPLPFRDPLEARSLARPSLLWEPSTAGKTASQLGVGSRLCVSRLPTRGGGHTHPCLCAQLPRQCPLCSCSGPPATPLPGNLLSLKP